MSEHLIKEVRRKCLYCMWAETSEPVLAQGVRPSASKHISVVDFKAVIIKKKKSVLLNSVHITSLPAS